MFTSLVRLSAVGPLLLLLLAGCEHPSAEPADPPPPAVAVTTVTQKDVPIYAEWVATLDGFVNARIQPQVTGYVVKQNYRDGSSVRQGEVLFEIDPRPFQAVLDQARGQLEQLEAQQLKASQDVERDRPLAEARAIPQSQFDTELTTLTGAKASVQAARAQVEQAELNLGFTKVRSLIDGLAGIATVQIGNLVGTSSILTTVSQVQPIKAFFSIAEADYLRAPAAVVGTGRHGVAADRNGPPSLQLILADGTAYAHRGEYFATDRAVDLQTGTITIAATFPNPGGILRPGQFGRVRARVDTLTGAFVVPQQAVTELQGSHQVAVVAGDNTATIRTVTVGPRVDSDWVIQHGLQAGDRVVVEGMQKVRDGVRVTPEPYQPSRGQGER